MILRVLIICCIFLSTAQAMLSDGVHTREDYMKFVETQEAFKSTCYVYDHYRSILQTGVLIAPDVVMTAAHGLAGKIHLKGIIVGFGDTVAHDSLHNYEVKAIRTHPRYYHTEYPMQAKYDMAFLKLKTPVKGIKPIPLFEKKILNEIPPLYVATFGNADLPHASLAQRRAFVFPETDIFSITGRDPEALYDYKTVMMGAIFFEPKKNMKPVKSYASERALRTYKANQQWASLNYPPYALTLPGSSGAPVFINILENGETKTYVFGIIQSLSHLSASSFRHAAGSRETHHVLHSNRKQIYGHYQSVFCVPYKLYLPLEAYKKTQHTYQLSRHVKKILDEFEEGNMDSSNLSPASGTKEKHASKLAKGG